MRKPEDPYPGVIQRTLVRVVDGDLEGARAALEEIHFEPQARVTERSPGVSAIARVYARDKYQCRYCGEKVILTPVMRLLSRLYPDAFPYHQNWKADVTHPAFITRSATLDHVDPIALGGDPLAETNVVTACWGCNRRKGDLRLEEIGWTLQEPGDPHWKGLADLFEPAWISAGRPPLGDDEMAWMRATRSVSRDAGR